MKKRILPLLLAASFSAAVAAPTAPVVVNGQATFAQQGNVFSITNTPNTIINWQSFNIAPGEITRFIQQNADSAVLNRITGQDPSQILGALQSNGHVFLINPNGIMFGKDARIDVQGLTASTLNISNADFIAGKRNFADAGGAAGKVVNQGRISTPAGGSVFLIASSVENSGIITSPQGQVVLAAGHSVQLVDSANPDLHVVVSAPADQAINLGQVIAQGGRIGIYGALVNQRGVVNANSAVLGANGKIVLKASRDTLLEQGSVTTATGAGTGGDIRLLGERVGLTGDAQVDASGATGGGTVLVGGDYQGANAAQVAHARNTWLGQGASIKADATQTGNGGKVVLWSDGATSAFGSISARGGANGGNGGLVETSGHNLITAGLRVNTSAARGTRGSWLLDPQNIVIGTVDDGVSLSDLGLFESLPGLTANVAAATLVNANTDIVLKATDDITFNAALNLSHGLQVNAGHTIAVNANISAGNIGLTATTINVANNTVINATNGCGSTCSLEFKADNVNFGTTGTFAKASGSGGVISFTPLTSSRPMQFASTRDPSKLSLTAYELGSLTASEVNIGSSASTGDFTWNLYGAYPGAYLKVMVIETGGNITINNGIQMQDGGTIVLGNYGSGALTITGSGSLDAGNIFLRSESMSIQGSVGTASTGTIWLDSYQPSTTLNLGGATTSSEWNIDATELAKLHAWNLNIGGDPRTAPIVVQGAFNFTPNAANGAMLLNSGAGGITVNAPLTVGGSGTTLSLKSTQGVITQNSSAPLTAPRLNLEGSASTGVDFELSNSPNLVGVLSGTNVGNVYFQASDTVTVGDSTHGLSTSAGATGPSLYVGANTRVSVNGNVSAGSAGSVVLDAPLIEIGLPLDGAGVSTGVSNASISGLVVSAVGDSSGSQLTISNGASITAGASVYVSTDKVQFENGAHVGVTSGTFAVAPATSGRKIDLGAGATDSADTLGLSDSELRAVDASSITIANHSELAPGLISVVGALDLTGSSHLSSFLIAPKSAGFKVNSGASLRTLKTINIVGGGPVVVDGLIESVLDTVSLTDVDSVSTGAAGLIKANLVSFLTFNGVGTVTQPLNTQARMLFAQTSKYGSAAPLSIVNNAGAPGPLTINGAMQYGDGLGDVSVVNYGAMDMYDHGSSMATVQTTSGNIHLETHSPLTISGLVKTTSGNVDLIAGNGGALSVSGNGAIQAGTGQVTLTGGTITVPDNVISSTKPAIRVPNGTNTPPPPPPPDPTVAECLATPSIDGCGPILEAAKQACIVNPSAPECHALLPTLDVCKAQPTLEGCSAVLPKVAECVANPAKDGCAVVLPNAATCAAHPDTAGCSVVSQCLVNPAAPGCGDLLPPIGACIGDKTLPGCDAVLPKLDQCRANPTAQGCSVVLPQFSACLLAPSTAGCDVVLPSIDTCIGDKAKAGCSVVLPPLSQCVQTPGQKGCTVVLPQITECIAHPTAEGCTVVLPTVEQCLVTPSRQGCVVVMPTIEACIAKPSTNGCVGVLPKLEECVVNPTRNGCTVVLPKMEACIADPARLGCAVVLPTLAECVSSPSLPGCTVRLPTLTQCIAAPTLQGCGVVLPKIEQCAVNPNLQGCEAVLPKPDFCSTHPTDPTCRIVAPGSGTGTQDAGGAVKEAASQVVTLINSSTGKGGQTQSTGTTDEKPSGKTGSGNTSGPAGSETNQGAKNEKPATKMYCN